MKYFLYSVLANIIIYATVPFMLIPETGFTQNESNGWDTFGDVTFKRTYFPEANAHFLVPQFDAEIKAKEGKMLTLTGYVMPIEVGDERVIILSRYPYSQCFFCGAAGPESVAEIRLREAAERFVPDTRITVKGYLRLNAADVNHLNFQLYKAIITKVNP